ncbi:uncharacterized protein J8A68_001792 [[Candida] subhashii]|uniref:Uncharacterized protein n=1 Tax=[Candida] subhashii TaxID=561895 RepID=A0A8J5QQD7_9ASCO|nr:uncharacterized protein J8A68_001792 [[Candida] subhashii]KAG7664695.1 hypothetical protein J8A68_001792 [[Candida] subhashii]
MFLVTWLLLLITTITSVANTAISDININNDVVNLKFLNQNLDLWKRSNTTDPIIQGQLPPSPPPPSTTTPKPTIDSIAKPSDINTGSSNSEELPSTKTEDLSIEVTAQGKLDNKKKWHVGAGLYFNKEIDYYSVAEKEEGSSSEFSGSGSGSCSDSEDEGKKGWFRSFAIDGYNNQRNIIPTSEMVSRASGQSHNLYTEENDDIKKVKGKSILSRPRNKTYTLPTEEETIKKQQQTDTYLLGSEKDDYYRYEDNGEISQANSIYLIYKYWRSSLCIVFIYILFS